MQITGLAKHIHRRKVGIVITLILVLALALRMYGINWDQGHGFHPDERSIYMQSDCMYLLLTETPGYESCPLLKDFPDTEAGIPSIKTFFDENRSPLNPHWFPLGSIIIYLLVFLRYVLEPFTNLSAFDMRFVGRSLSALADVGSIFLLFSIGRRIFNLRIGLLAAFLMSIAVIHVQHSHFYRPETFIVLFVLASYYFMLNITERDRLRDWLLLGLFTGLTFATKVSVLPLLVPLFTTFMFSIFGSARRPSLLNSPNRAFRIFKYGLAGAIIAISVFLILTPYALIDLQKFMADTTWEASIAREAGKMPYTIQYIGTIPFLYELTQTTVWALGIPLGITVWCGLLYAVFRIVTRKSGWKGDLLLLAWIIPSFVLVAGFFEVKFLRYMFPIVPFLILLGSRALIDLVKETASISRSTLTGRFTHQPLLAFRKYSFVFSIGIVVLIISTSLLYTLGFMKIYARSHPAIAASQWINQNLPPGTNIATDNHWDEGIPDLHQYDTDQIYIYNGESPKDIFMIANRLAKAQYLIFYSNRTYGSIARVPDRYPIRSNYYNKLFSGDLGYQFDKSFTSYPSILGIVWKNDTFKRASLPPPEELNRDNGAYITLNLGYSDENVANYDHPTVLLFRNVESLSHIELFKTITTLNPINGSNILDFNNDLMLSNEDLAIQRQGGTWQNIIHMGSWTNKVPVLAWLLMIQLIYLAALPLAFFIFRPLPDRGIVLAKLLGILGVTYISWLLSSMHWLSFSRASMLVSLLILSGISLIILFKNHTEIVTFLRRKWRLLLLSEVIFFAAFLSFVAVRMANPDLWHPWLGGEKPMDLAYLNAILRSTHMPPYDPWFAGGFINYYYWGHFVIANLVKATGILPTVAYNLAIPLLFALTVTASYSIVYNVTEGLNKTIKKVEHAKQSSLHWIKSPVMAGLIGALFVTVIGNLDGAIQLIESGWSSIVRAEQFGSFEFWRSSRMIPELPDINPSFVTFWLNDATAHIPGSFCPQDLRADNTCPNISPHITEFPFFSFLFADLHAHVIAIPFTLLVIGIGLSFLVGLKNESFQWIVSTLPFLALALGSLWAINAWDYPSYLLLLVCLLSVGTYLMMGRVNHYQRVWILIGLVTSTLLLSFLAFLPFHMHYDTFGSLLGQSTWQTPLSKYLAIHGLFLFIILTFLIFLNRIPLKHFIMSLGSHSVSLRRKPDHINKTLFPLNSTIWISILPICIVIYLAVAGYWTASFLTILIWLALMGVRKEFTKPDEGSTYLLFPVILAGFSFLTAVGVEFILVGEDIGRMNTLFKFYLQSWVLMSLAAAIGLWYLSRQISVSLSVRPFAQILVLGAFTLLLVLTVMALAFVVGVEVDHFRFSGVYGRLEFINNYSIHVLIFIFTFIGLFTVFMKTRKTLFDLRYPLLKTIWLVALITLAVSSLIYVGLGSRDRISHRFDTTYMSLNGEQFMAKGVHWEKGQSIDLKWDLDIIHWLRNNVNGSPVILEAHTEQYRWGARIASYTGLPTILGWPWHQIQQRGDYSDISERASDIKTIYSTHNHQQAMELIELYNIRYIIVGPLENIWYPASGLSKFPMMANQQIVTIAHQNPRATIYEIPQDSH